MNKKIGVSALVAGLACTSWASVWWKGPAGTADWNVSTNWDGGKVPPAAETAKFEKQGNGFLFRLTPPADFTGTIWLGQDVNARAVSMTVELTVLEGASWTVNNDNENQPGCGTVIATPGIAERISPNYTGTIEVPAGRTFVAPATLNPAVKFTGAGKLQLSTAAQFAQAAGFVGEISLAPGSEVTPETLGILQNARLALNDGETVTLPAGTLGTTAITPLDGFATPDAWSFNGSVYAEGPNAGGPNADTFKFNAAPPSVTPEGNLLLTDDPAQVHTAFYKAHKFSANENWTMSFTWTPEIPAPSRVLENGWAQVRSGHFGFYLQKNGADSVDMTNKQIPSPDARGFVLYIYEGGAKHFEWITEYGYSFDDAEYVPETALDGILFNDPIDFTVACNQGVLCVTMKQGEKSATFRKDFSDYIAGAGEGVFAGFGGTSDLWPDSTTSIPWMKQTISNFSGWYSARNSGGWQTVPDQSSFYPFTPETWDLNSFYIDGSIKRGEEAAINKDGSFQIIPAENQAAGIVTCKRVIDTGKPCLLSFDYRFGECPGGEPNGGSAEGLEFGFQQLPLTDDGIRKLTRSADGTWNGQLMNWAMGWGFNYYFWGAGNIELRRQFGPNAGELAWKAYKDKHAGILIPHPQSTAHFDVMYDAKGSLRVFGTVTPDDKSIPGSQAEFVQTLTPAEFAQFKAEMGNHCRISFAGYSSNATVDRYQDTAIRNLTFKELTDNAAPTLTAPLAVPAGASVTLKAGLAMAEGVSPAMTLANVALAEGATLHVAPEADTTRVAIETVAPKATATLAADAGTTLTIGTYAPEDIRATLKLTGSVAFEDVLTVVVPAKSLRDRQVHTLIDLSQATVVKTPTTVRVVDENGNELAADRYEPRVKSSEITLTIVRPGVMILIY